MPFKIIDSENAFRPIKSGFLTSAQALDWAKKNLADVCKPFGEHGVGYRYFIQKY